MVNALLHLDLLGEDVGDAGLQPVELGGLRLEHLLILVLLRLDLPADLLEQLCDRLKLLRRLILLRVEPLSEVLDHGGGLRILVRLGHLHVRLQRDQTVLQTLAITTS